MTMISDRLTDEQLAEILSGAVDGMEPTTQELAMAAELQELRKQNELQRGELLKAHITLLNQQKQIQKYHNTDSSESVSIAPEDLRRSLEAVARLNNEMYRWTSCLSYNGSYVGEPEGLLKRNIREIEHIMDTCRAAMLEGGINR